MSITDEVARAMFPRSPNYGPHQVYTRKAIAVFARWLREPSEEMLLKMAIPLQADLPQSSWVCGEEIKDALRALAAHIEDGK